MYNVVHRYILSLIILRTFERREDVAQYTAGVLKQGSVTLVWGRDPGIRYPNDGGIPGIDGG
jgi:hypothetical protein